MCPELRNLNFLGKAKHQKSCRRPHHHRQRKMSFFHLAVHLSLAARREHELQDKEDKIFVYRVKRLTNPSTLVFTKSSGLCLYFLPVVERTSTWTWAPIRLFFEIERKLVQKENIAIKDFKGKIKTGKKIIFSDFYFFLWYQKAQVFFYICCYFLIDRMDDFVEIPIKLAGLQRRTV